MGLCIGTKNAEYDDTFHIGYGAFYLLKQEIVNSISKRAGELHERWVKAGIMPKFYEPLTDDELKEFNELLPDGLAILLDHSDCDGSLTYQESRAIYKAIKNVKIESEHAKPFFKQLKKVLQNASKIRRNLYFY